VRVLFVGDVVGRPGRNMLIRQLPLLRDELKPNLVVVNAENAAGGFGITPAVAEELFAAGADVLTTGNHIWDQREVLPYLDGPRPILRPINYPEGVPGRGCWHWRSADGTGEAIIVNAMGRIFMSPIDCPFKALDSLLSSLDAQYPIIVDFHAEATSEKQAMGWFLDGRVSAVVGTHTHVPSADARVLPRGTAFVTDVGMTGPLNSVIGVAVEPILEHFVRRVPMRLEVAKGPCVLNAVLIDIDEDTLMASQICRVDKIEATSV
jgi:metallophosphoesterase (TIGR00282 family)